MYIVLFLLFVFLGAALLSHGVRHHRLGTLIAGSSVVCFTLAFFWLLDFWGEMLWFNALGYGQRFWTALFARWGAALAGACLGGLIVYLFMLSVPARGLLPRIAPVLLAALVGGLWGSANWARLLRYLYQVPTEIRDPIFQRDTAFYLFSLPFYDALYWGLFLIVAIALGATLFSTTNLARAIQEGDCTGSSTVIQRPGDSYR